MWMMTSAVGRQFTGNRPQKHKEDPYKDCSTGGGARPNPPAELNNRGKRSTSDSPCLLSQSRIWELQTYVDQIPLGKLQVMEKFFTPVKLDQGIRGGLHDKGEHPATGHHHRHHPHHSHRHHPHHSQPHNRHLKPLGAEDQEGHGCPHAGEDVRHHHRGHHSQGHHHEHPHLPHNEHHHHCHHKGHLNAGVISQACTHPHTSATASTSICSTGSSSSSSSSWSSEVSIENEAFLVDSRCKLHYTQHSLSCTDISKPRRAIGEGDEKEHTKPLLADDCRLYKSASFERSLASRDNPEILQSRRPMKAVSSIQLPTKSILKSKQGQGGGIRKAGNFRKAKSMEVLSSQDERTGFGTSGRGAGNLINERDLEQKKEKARQDLMKQKLQFSAFLNEITRQVLSPSRLSSLGVTNAQKPANVGLTSPKLPRDECSGQGYRQVEEKQRQQHNRPSSPVSLASSALSHCSGYSHSSQHQHQHHHSTTSGSPQLRCNTSGSHTDASTSPENSPSLEQGQDQRVGKQHHGGSHNLLTDSANTSPEHSPSLPRRNSNHSHSHGHHQYNYSAQHSPTLHHHQPKPAHSSPSHREASPGTTVTPGQEAYSSRLDSPQNIASPEPKQTSHMFTEDVMSEVNRIQILQRQNEGLHHSLLQTAMRMECMEVEFKTNHQQLEFDLQRTQQELAHLKEKFKRLQENYSSTQQTNQLLEQKLQSVSLSMGGERGSLSKRILELTEQLATAQTIQSLEIINVPSLFQEAPGKGFEAEDTANPFLLPAAPPPTQFMDNDHYNMILGTGENQPLGPMLDEVESDWSAAGKGIQKSASKESGGGQESVAGFLPWIQGQDKCLGPQQDQKGEVDSGSESGRYQEGIRLHSPHSLQIPHLQFTMHPETLPVPTADLSLARFRRTLNSPTDQSYGVTAMQTLSSPIRVLSASLEEMRSTGVQQYQPSPVTLKCTECVTSLHHPEGGTLEDSDGADIVGNLRKKTNKGNSGGVGGVGENSEPKASLLRYQAAPKMVSHFACQLQPIEVKTQGWSDEVTEAVLNGESTQL